MIMEWAAEYYDDLDAENPVIKCREGFQDFNYLIFDGISYQINLAKPAGRRIEQLTWPDGSPVSDEERFIIAVNSYTAASVFMIPGVVFEKDDIPALAGMDVEIGIGGIRELIMDYIENVKKGTIRPECDHNWKLVLHE